MADKNRIISYKDALNEALRQEMQRDENVIVIGEDVGVYGGGFEVTGGLIREFGPKRVLDTPISEAAFIGTAIGAALGGLRPVAELMFGDFMAVCWDQIMNEAAKIRFMYGNGLSVPMVIRTAQGGGTGAAAQHSQSLESMYCHVPGLKVVMPATPYDAKGLLVSSIRDNDPVIFLEGKLLYEETGEVPEQSYSIPLGKADIKREGKDISLITYGRMLGDCLKAASALQNEGIDCEIIDLRTLVPLDRDTMLSSVAKTGRAVIVHESVQFGGFGAELLSQIMESEVYGSLKAPVRRLGAKYCPIPSSPTLEASVFPDAGAIIKAVKEAMKG